MRLARLDPFFRLARAGGHPRKLQVCGSQSADRQSGGPLSGDVWTGGDFYPVTGSTVSQRWTAKIGNTLAVGAIAIFLAAPAHAVDPTEILPDAALESRARAISSELRCLVCQNQSIDDSNAPLAKDLRVLVRERLSAGESDRAVVDYIVARYGDFVLLKPPFNSHTLLLWFAPLLCLAGLGFAITRAAWARGTAGAASASGALTPAEEAKLRELLKAPPDLR